MPGFAIVGCGMIARFHAKALAEVPGARLAALVSRRAAGAKKMADELGLHESLPGVWLWCLVVFAIAAVTDYLDGYLARRAHHPQKEIDVVDGLVHQSPAAVERLGPLPAALVVVRLRPPPLAGRLAEGDAAELAGLDGPLQGDVGVGEARREDGAQLNAVAVARLDDAVAALQGDF